MSSRLPTILDDLFPDSSPEFREIKDVWPPHVVNQILRLVWEGFDRMKALPNFDRLDFSKEYAQLERSLTGLHMEEITKLWGEQTSSFESFQPKHEPWEFETLKSRSARPPSCDLGFILLSNRRFRWAVEAKVLQTATAVAEYLDDLDKYLAGQIAPLSMQGALAAYLVEGDPDEFFGTVAAKCKCDLTPSPDFRSRPHRCSTHERGRRKLTYGMPTVFICHHLALALT